MPAIRNEFVRTPRATTWMGLLTKLIQAATAKVFLRVFRIAGMARSYITSDLRSWIIRTIPTRLIRIQTTSMMNADRLKSKMSE